MLQHNSQQTNQASDRRSVNQHNLSSNPEHELQSRARSIGDWSNPSVTLAMVPPLKPLYRRIGHRIGDRSTNTTWALVQSTSHQARGIGDQSDLSITLAMAPPLRTPYSLKVFHLYISLSFPLLHNRVNGFGVCSLTLLAFAVECGVSKTLCLCNTP